MGFFSQIEAPIKAVLDQLFADTRLRDDVTYRKYTGQAWSDEDGASVSTFSESELPVIRLQHLQSSKFVGIGSIEAGDQLYLIRSTDAVEGMSLKDEILDEMGNTQKIKSLNDIFGLAMAITLEGGSVD